MIIDELLALKSSVIPYCLFVIAIIAMVGCGNDKDEIRQKFFNEQQLSAATCIEKGGVPIWSSGYGDHMPYVNDCKYR